MQFPNDVPALTGYQLDDFERLISRLNELQAERDRLHVEWEKIAYSRHGVAELTHAVDDLIRTPLSVNHSTRANSDITRFRAALPRVVALVDRYDQSMDRLIQIDQETKAIHSDIRSLMDTARSQNLELVPVKPLHILTSGPDEAVSHE